MRNDGTVISVRNVSKKYHLYDNSKLRLKEALNPFGKKYHREFWALKDVSFDVPRGETYGIIGRNGSGKSTLLQLVCKIMQPSSGSINTYGRTSALLELGAGFNPEFTGRSNVYMNGALMGLSKDEIENQMEAVENFADIGEFIDQPVKIYSSGMYVRLAFSCAINVKPDILIVDEALSVGDVFFQQKCFAKIREIIAGGTTCLFVSHDTAAIMNVCTKAILFHNGEIVFQGEPEETVSRYYGMVGSRSSVVNCGEEKVNYDINNNNDLMSASDVIEHNILRSSNKRHGAGGLEVVAARVTDKIGRDTLEVRMMESLNIYVLLRSKETIYNPRTGIHLYDRFGNLVFAAGTRQLKKRLPDLNPEQELLVRMEITLSVQPGEYTFSLGAGEPSTEGVNIGYIQDRHEMLGPIVVTADQNDVFPFYGIAQLPMKIFASFVDSKES